MIMKIVIIGDVHEKRFVEEMFHARSGFFIGFNNFSGLCYFFGFAYYQYLFSRFQRLEEGSAKRDSHFGHL